VFCRGPPGQKQIGTQIEQIVLDTAQHRIEIAVGLQADQADHGVGFVHRAAGGDPHIVFGDTFAVTQRGLPGIAAAGVDA